MPTLERAQDRLENVRGVKPILDALQTISMGSWQAALRRKRAMERYYARLAGLIPLIVPHLDQPPAPRETGEGRLELLVIGTERGLCGAFNTTLIDRLADYLDQRGEDDVRLMVLGGRLRRLLERRDYELAWERKLPTTALPPLDLATALLQRWLAPYEAHELAAVEVLYNTYQGMGSYRPTVRRLLPPQIEVEPGEGADSWNPVIVETDPRRLYEWVVERLLVLNVHRVLVESAAAEHAARYSLMESASQNADRLIEELTLDVQSARQRAITREMQELAAGAGLLED